MNKKPPKTSSCLVHDRRLLAELSRRQMLQTGASLTAFMGVSQLFGTKAFSQSFPVAKRLVWINMSGGWDVLEITDPKVASTSGIDMTYDYNLAQQIGTGDAKIGRWLSRLARSHGDSTIALRGINMGTTSHMAGSVYMDTGILSNSGQVNSASIPAIVASESQATIPIIQLNGGSDPKTDRGLLNPVSVVRAQNLDLYRSMYPEDQNELAQKMLMLDHLKQSITRVENVVGANDRLSELYNAEEKVRVQFESDVGAKLVLTDADRAPFLVDAPRTMDGGRREAFALALKLLKNDLVSCINLGIGGFDTHANQERSMQPIVEGFDYLLTVFLNELKTAGQLDNTLVVVYSDFGRTPKVNNRSGRDHWPFGGALMIGGGIDGGRAVGATDDDMRGISINTSTGLADTGGVTLNPTHLAGSVLELTLGSAYLPYRTYLQSIPALTRLKA